MKRKSPFLLITNLLFFAFGIVSVFVFAYMSQDEFAIANSTADAVKAGSIIEEVDLRKLDLVVRSTDALSATCDCQKDSSGAYIADEDCGVTGNEYEKTLLGGCYEVVEKVRAVLGDDGVTCSANEFYGEIEGKKYDGECGYPRSQVASASCTPHSVGDMWNECCAEGKSKEVTCTSRDATTGCCNGWSTGACNQVDAECGNTGGETHTECKDGACVKVDGPGGHECTEGPDPRCQLGQSVCNPGESRCKGGEREECRNDGTGWKLISNPWCDADGDIYECVGDSKTLKNNCDSAGCSGSSCVNQGTSGGSCADYGINSNSDDAAYCVKVGGHVSSNDPYNCPATGGIACANDAGQITCAYAQIDTPSCGAVGGGWNTAGIYWEGNTLVNDTDQSFGLKVCTGPDSDDNPGCPISSNCVDTTIGAKSRKSLGSCQQFDPISGGFDGKCNCPNPGNEEEPEEVGCFEDCSSDSCESGLTCKTLAGKKLCIDGNLANGDQCFNVSCKSMTVNPISAFVGDTVNIKANWDWNMSSSTNFAAVSNRINRYSDDGVQVLKNCNGNKLCELNWDVPPFEQTNEFQLFSVLKFNAYGSEHFCESNGDIIATTLGSAVVGSCVNNCQTKITKKENPETDMSITKTAPAVVKPGQTFTYTIGVENESQVLAKNVQVKDVLPSDVSFVSASAPGLSTTYNSGLVIFQLGDMASETTKTLTIHVKVKANISDGKVIVNEAKVSTDTLETNYANNEAEARSTVEIDITDLEIVKTVNKTIAKKGDTLNYTLTIKNLTDVAAENIWVFDTLPNGVNPIDVPAIQAQGCEIGIITGVTTVQSIQCDLGTMGAMSTKVIKFSAVVTLVGEGNLLNVAEVTTSTPETTLSNNVSKVNTNVYVEEIPESKLQITKIDLTDPVVAGQSFKYVIEVTNVGEITEEDVYIVDTLPEGFTYVMYEGSNTDCQTLSDNRFRCDFKQNLEIGDTWTVTVQVSVGVEVLPNTYTNYVTAFSLVQETGVSTFEETTVIRESNLIIEKIDSKDPVVAGGDSFDYIITVVNEGPSVASDVYIIDTLPSQFIYQTFSSNYNGVACATLSENRIRCRLNKDLAVGESWEVKIKVKVDSDTDEGTYTNEVYVYWNQYEIGKRAEEDTTVTTIADLSIIKTDSNDPVNPEDLLTYKLVARNDGPSSARNVVIVDELPNDVTFVKVNRSNVDTCDYDEDNHEVVCELSKLRLHDIIEISIVVKINKDAKAGKIYNRVEVDSDTDDDDPSNNKDEEDTLIKIPEVKGIEKKLVSTGSNIMYNLIAAFALLIVLIFGRRFLKRGETQYLEP